ncbi:large subunit ribosomal protein L4 [Frankineae bacterium MT45]|nr:large subunit ribosomal protein L4 [Frankineae bacterium MT45]
MTATLTVLNPADAKAKTGTVELPAEIFDVPTNIPLIHQVVVAQLAAARQGTHATKTRAEVRGGGKKPYRQKGTGRARQGSTRAPQFVGGGVVHGPQPRSYAQRTPKKMIAGALRCALSDRARNDRIHVVTSLVGGDTPSTKTATSSLASVSSARNILVVAERNDDATWLSLRNHHAVHILEPGQLNTYDVLISDDIVFTEQALATFIAGPAKGKSAKGAASSLEVDAAIDETKVDVETKAEPKAPKAAKKTAKADTAEATEAVEAKAKPAKKAAAKKAAAKTDESATASADAVTEEEA